MVKKMVIINLSKARKTNLDRKGASATCSGTLTDRKSGGELTGTYLQRSRDKLVELRIEAKNSRETPSNRFANELFISLPPPNWDYTALLQNSTPGFTPSLRKII